jgi:NAD-dependent SIR2 family protein deacetylase
MSSTTTTTAAAAAAAQRAAQFIHDADTIFIGTGAGMGVASGIGTFRGVAAGIWPPLEKRAIRFEHMSNPEQFQLDERFAWSFWQYRFVGYTSSLPNDGYHILHRWCRQKAQLFAAQHDSPSSSSLPAFRGFSFTSNIDGHWLASGFPQDNVVECHGSVRFMQCQGELNSCDNCEIWPTNPEEITRMQVR